MNVVCCHSVFAPSRPKTPARVCSWDTLPPGVVQGKTIEMYMPALSSTMEEGTIVQWLKEVGDKIEVTDYLTVLRTQPQQQHSSIGSSWDEGESRKQPRFALRGSL